LPVLVLLTFGIIDFGHAWHMDHVISDACREGTRYGSRFQTDNAGNRVLPKSLSPSITNYILQSSAQNSGKGGWGLTNLLPSCASPTVATSGPAAAETNPTLLAGEDLTVTVTATKTWFVLGKLIPGWTNTKTLTVTTTMKCE
jgi:Flp pilus assembly protein TadG